MVQVARNKSRSSWAQPPPSLWADWSSTHNYGKFHNLRCLLHFEQRFILNHITSGIWIFIRQNTLPFITNLCHSGKGPRHNLTTYCCHRWRSLLMSPLLLRYCAPVLGDVHCLPAEGRMRVVLLGRAGLPVSPHAQSHAPHPGSPSSHHIPRVQAPSID